MKRELVKVGFWKDTKSFLDLVGMLQNLPDPRELVDHEWMKDKRDRIAQYLDAAPHVNAWMGYSYCRFGCTGVDMGTADLSDGTYLWPEGLSHYVRVHHVRLPKKFTEHIFKRIGKSKPEAHCSERDVLLAQASKELGEWLAEKRRSRAQ